MKRDAVLYRKENPQQTALPIDALTASASGLDPHISLANALVQVPRVAAARKLSPGIVKRLVGQLAENNFLTESPYINVLELNLALDQLQGKMQLAKAK